MKALELVGRQAGPNRLERTRTVLLIDDDVVTRLLVAHRIASMGADVFEADDGVEGLHCLEGASIDLVIVDLEMPNMDGWDVIRRIRGHPKTRHLPIIVLSGNENPSALKKSMLMGAAAYLLKPLNWSEFGAHIAHLLQLPHNSVPQTVPSATG